MKVKRLQDYMVSLMKLKEDTRLLYGKLSIIALIICRLLLLLMRRSCACMEEFQKTCIVLTRLSKFLNLLMFLIMEWLLIYFGMILMKMSKTGKRMKEDVDLSSVKDNLKSS